MVGGVSGTKTSTGQTIGRKNRNNTHGYYDSAS